MQKMTREERITKITQNFEILNNRITNLDSDAGIQDKNKRIIKAIHSIVIAASTQMYNTAFQNRTGLSDYSELALSMTRTYSTLLRDLLDSARTMHPYELSQHTLNRLKNPSFAILSQNISVLEQTLHGFSEKLEPAYREYREARRKEINKHNEEVASKMLTGSCYSIMFNGLSAMMPLGGAYVPTSFILLAMGMTLYTYASSDYQNMDEYLAGAKNVAKPAMTNTGLLYCLETAFKVAERGAHALADRANRWLDENPETQTPRLENGQANRITITDVTDTPDATTTVRPRITHV